MNTGFAANPAWDELYTFLSAFDGVAAQRASQTRVRPAPFQRPHPMMDDAHGKTTDAKLDAEAAQAKELEDLVVRARRGEGAAQEALIAAYRRRLGGFIYGMLGDSSHVDDLTQTVFVRIFLSLDRLRETARFEAWLFKAARNACLSHLRRERFRRLFSPLSDRHEEVAAQTPAVDQEPSDDLLLLRAALKTLPARDRALLLLVQDRETGYEEIAAGYGITVGALKTRVHRAKALLKLRIERTRHEP
ncbi:RNA polymerase sigma-70 factor, ECF subfamily [Verrucomicrobium sp. GAS474]|uniref:RNA polymerase sigma factor n=1 Tax=Verrucomicrobium sp. GAS474 TaxID=1882831 RepID=UPI00087C1CC0|nr:RNA polymerase sigma factor [Verrucomicrobium sp. GAS474]SDT92104.1 RNA polymerase sigma-70 factor, ECF subfamily [Verrucomicrobium sp. GAS474]